jgi:hypothetical protein
MILEIDTTIKGDIVIEKNMMKDTMINEGATTDEMIEEVMTDLTMIATEELHRF